MKLVTARKILHKAERPAWCLSITKRVRLFLTAAMEDPGPRFAPTGFGDSFKGYPSSIRVWCRCVFELERRKKVTLLWVPAYVGLEGNEKTDKLVTKGATTPLVWPETFCALRDMIFTRQIRKAKVENRSKYWKNRGRTDAGQRAIRRISPQSVQSLHLQKRLRLFLTG